MNFPKLWRSQKTDSKIKKQFLSNFIVTGMKRFKYVAKVKSQNTLGMPPALYKGNTHIPHILKYKSSSLKRTTVNYKQRIVEMFGWVAVWVITFSQYFRQLIEVKTVMHCLCGKAIAEWFSSLHQPKILTSPAHVASERLSSAARNAWSSRRNQYLTRAEHFIFLKWNSVSIICKIWVL